MNIAELPVSKTVYANSLSLLFAVIRYPFSLSPNATPYKNCDQKKSSFIGMVYIYVASPFLIIDVYAGPTSKCECELYSNPPQ